MTSAIQHRYLTNDGVSLYVHFPYCLSRCTYCDFNTYVADSIPGNSYLDAVLAEGAARSPQWADHQLLSIYFGGGTPSLWGAECIGRVVAAARGWFSGVDDRLEVTVECNPSEVNAELMTSFRLSGVNRVSIGLQCLEDELLKKLGRRHGAQEGLDALNVALLSGFKSVSADLIFGLPAQSVARWSSDLRTVADTGVPHVSVYHLTLEPGTAMTRDVNAGRIKLPGSDEQADMWDAIGPALQPFGLHAYEVSNFSRTGHESRHNSGYWVGRPYLGLGAGAHSFLPPTAWDNEDACGMRMSNLRKPGDYMRCAINGHSTVDWSESIDVQTHLRERMFTGLRNSAGVVLSDIEQELGVSPTETYGSVISDLLDENLATLNSDQLVLTDTGLRYADSVFLRFF